MCEHLSDLQKYNSYWNANYYFATSVEWLGPTARHVLTCIEKIFILWINTNIPWDLSSLETENIFQWLSNLRQKKLFFTFDCLY